MQTNCRHAISPAAMGLALARRPTVSLRWQWHDDARGFQLRMPTHWRVSVSQLGEVMVQAPDGIAIASVRPQALDKHTPLMRWLRDHYAHHEQGLHNVRVDRSQCLSPHRAVMTFDYGSHLFRGHASVLAWRHGHVVTLHVAAASRAHFARRVDDLAGVLGSVRFNALLAPLSLVHPATGHPMTVVAKGAFFFSAHQPLRRPKHAALRAKTWSAADFANALHGSA